MSDHMNESGCQYDAPCNLPEQQVHEIVFQGAR
jgi:hypothetical protein